MKDIGRVLSIDTTGPYLGIALHAFDANGFPGSAPMKCLSRFWRRVELRHSDYLFPVMSRLMRRAKLKRSDIDLIAVNNGPGSFTGVRVGVASARALGQALARPVVAVHGLELIAQEIAVRADKNIRWIAACQQALPGEVYGALYRSDGDAAAHGLLRVASAPVWESIEDWNRRILRLIRNEAQGPRGSVMVAGDRLGGIRQEFTMIPAVKWADGCYPKPDGLARCAVRRWFMEKRKSIFHFSRVEALYLQPSWAERSAVS